jgi:hypothetical protein
MVPSVTTSPSPSVRPELLVKAASVNVRSGPGAVYEVKATTAAGERWYPSAQAGNCAWFQIAGGWLTGDPALVQFTGRCEDVPQGLVPPTPVGSPTPTPAPVEITVAGCDASMLDVAIPVYVRGYLIVPAGTYSSASWRYDILLAAQPSSTGPTIGLSISTGSAPSSMYFDQKIARIKDKKGVVIPWITRNGQEVYITSRSVLVRGSLWGTPDGKCEVTSDSIE